MKPLEGVKVVDLTLTHAGTMSTLQLADHGAEIIKIEPTTGEAGRSMAPLDKDGNSGYFAFLNRGKKSVAVDITTEEGRDIVKKLAKEADVVVENFSGGFMEKCGLGYEELKKDNPKLIYASLSGYGHTGPRKDLPALEVQMQSMSGISSISGFPEQGPVRAGGELACHVGGTYLSMAIVIALIDAQKTGEGQQIDIAMLDSVLSMIEAAPIEYTLDGTERELTGNAYPSICPYDTFDTNDGSISVGVSTDRQWGMFCDALGLEDLKADPRYENNATRGSHYFTGLRDKIQEKIGTMSRFEMEKIMSDTKIPSGIVYEVSEAMEYVPVKERNMLIDVEDHTMGKVTMPGTVVKFGGEEEGTKEGAPKVGENTKEYLAKIGYSDEEMKALADKGVIAMA